MRYGWLLAIGSLMACGAEFTSGPEAAAGGAAGSSAGQGGSGGSDPSTTSSAGMGGMGGEGGTVRAAGGSAGAGGEGGDAPDPVGCSDGTREGFVDLAIWPNIAACDGGFSVAGLQPTTGIQCGRQGGDDSSNPDGDGCAADDLCAEGWDICASSGEVAASSPNGCEGLTDVPSRFYATRQSGMGLNECAPTGTDDVAGCGTLGGGAPASCAPLDRFSYNGCSGLTSSWQCGGNSAIEATVVTKPTVADGGVLCCRRFTVD